MGELLAVAQLPTEFGRWVVVKRLAVKAYQRNLLAQPRVGRHTGLQGGRIQFGKFGLEGFEKFILELFFRLAGLLQGGFELVPKGLFKGTVVQYPPLENLAAVGFQNRGIDAVQRGAAHQSQNRSFFAHDP